MRLGKRVGPQELLGAFLDATRALHEAAAVRKAIHGPQAPAPSEARNSNRETTL